MADLLRVPGPFEAACAGKGPGLEVTHACKPGSNEICGLGDPIPDMYEGKEVLCGAVYQQTIPNEVRRKLLVKNDDCKKDKLDCGELSRVPIVGNMLCEAGSVWFDKSLRAQIQEGRESFFQTIRLIAGISGIVIAIIVFLISVFLFYKKYKKTAIGFGLGGILITGFAAIFLLPIDKIF